MSDEHLGSISESHEEDTAWSLSTSSLEREFNTASAIQEENSLHFKLMFEQLQNSSLFNIPKNHAVEYIRQVQVDFEQVNQDLEDSSKKKHEEYEYLIKKEKELQEHVKQQNIIAEKLQDAYKEKQNVLKEQKKRRKDNQNLKLATVHYKDTSGIIIDIPDNPESNVAIITFDELKPNLYVKFFFDEHFDVLLDFDASAILDEKCQALFKEKFALDNDVIALVCALRDLVIKM